MKLHGLAAALQDKRLRRFVIAGFANTLFGFCVYSVAILAGLPVWGALIAGNLLGIAFNFVTTGGYVFRNLMVERLPRFVAAYVVIYLVNLVLIRWLSDWVSGSVAAQAVLTPPMAIFSYLLMKNFVFKTQ